MEREFYFVLKQILLKIILILLKLTPSMTHSLLHARHSEPGGPPSIAWNNRRGTGCLTHPPSPEGPSGRSNGSPLRTGCLIEGIAVEKEKRMFL